MHDLSRPDRRRILRLSWSASLAALAAGSGLPGVLQAQSLSEGGTGLEPRPSHFPAAAKRVIFLCMRGAPSHVDTFDHKPELTRASGKRGKYRGELMGSPWTFRQHGESGQWISELFPALAGHADRLCILNGMHCDQPNHPQAQTQLHTGTFQFVRPSLGAWLLYGLGTENPALPGFVTLSPFGSAQNYGSAFLPAVFQGTELKVEAGRAGRGGDLGDLASRLQRFRRRRRGTEEQSTPVPDLASPRLTEVEQRAQLDLIQRLDRGALERAGEHPGIEGALASSELAFAMQRALPGVLDLGAEDDATHALYGIDGSSADGFGRQLLAARRLSEAGVRFVQVTHGNWDHHRNLATALPENCAETDRPIAGLIEDLQRRGLLEETLVVWSGEFGRTPHSQGGNGRDHNHTGFSSWMAGGGVRGGLRHGATDELGYEAVSGKMHIHDWHATLLHLLGLDHERLTYSYAGRDFRLTDVHGHVHQEILARG